MRKHVSNEIHDANRKRWDAGSEQWAKPIAPPIRLTPRDTRGILNRLEPSLELATELDIMSWSKTS